MGLGERSIIMELFLFTTISISSLVLILYLPMAHADKRFPFSTRTTKVNSGAKFG